MSNTLADASGEDDDKERPLARLANSAFMDEDCDSQESASGNTTTTNTTTTTTTGGGTAIANAAPMSISLEGINPTPISRTDSGLSSAPASSTHTHRAVCAYCGKTLIDSRRKPGTFTAVSPIGSPLVVDSSGPLAVAAYESGMNAVDELRLLKAQVQDVARVCKAVAAGDLSQKITVNVEGVVMIQLKDVINTMVSASGRIHAHTYIRI
jgi:hypothetical protein